MYKFKLASITFALLFFNGNLALAADDTHAGKAVGNAGKASGNASASAAHSIAASGQVTSAIVAVPLSVGGAVLGSAGAVSAGAAHGSMKAASSPIGTPLVITDETITTMPPNEALKVKDKKKSDKDI